MKTLNELVIYGGLVEVIDTINIDNFEIRGGELLLLDSLTVTNFTMRGTTFRKSISNTNS